MCYNRLMPIAGLLLHVWPYAWPAALVAVLLATLFVINLRMMRRRLTMQHAIERREHAHLRMIVQQMPAAIWAVDPSLRFTWAEGAALANLHDAPPRLLGRTLYEYLDTRERSFRPVAAHEDAVRLGRSDSYEIPWKGRVFQVLVEPLRDADQQVIGAVGVALDITRVKVTEAALARSDARYAALLKAIPDLLLRLRGDGAIIEFIDNLAAPDPQSPRRHIRDILPAPAAQRLIECLHAALASRDAQVFEFQNPASPGGISTFEARLVAVGDDEALAMLRNITDRRRAEDELRQREAQLRSVLFAIPDLIFQFTLDGRYCGCIASNPDELLVPPDQFLGRTIHEVLPPEVASELQEGLQSVCETSQPRIMQYSLMIRGQQQWYEARMLACRDGQRQVIAMVRNITESRNTNPSGGV